MRRLLEPRYVGLALSLALMLGCFPSVAQAKMVGSMAAGARDVTPRQAREAEIHRLLGEAKVADALASVGLTAEQVRSKLDRLSDEQIEDLTQHLDTIQSGKGSSSVLVLAAAIIVLVAVLIYMMIESA